MTIETNADEFAKQVRKYAAIFGSRGKMGEVILDRAKHLAIELYGKTKVAAPTQAQIASDVQKQGWKIPKIFPDGRRGRGDPSQWAGTAIAALPKVRGRKSAARRLQEAQIRAQKPTLQQMQAFVIRERSRHIGYVATGWLAAIEDLGGYARGDHSRGGATFKESLFELHGEVDIFNKTPGIEEVEAKHGIIQAAIDAQMQYMGRKISEELNHELAAA